MKKSIILSVSFLLVVLALGVFWYVKNQKITTTEKPLAKVENKQEATPINTEEIDTSDWQTYRNEELGFEIKHPSAWEVKEFKSACLGLSDCAIDCEKTPEKCDVIGFSFYNKDIKNSETISIAMVPDRLKGVDFNLKTQWMDTMFSGCYVSVIKNDNQKKFYIGSFRPATDLNNVEITKKESALCKKNQLNPIFNKMIKNLIFVN